MGISRKCCSAALIVGTFLFTGAWRAAANPILMPPEGYTTETMHIDIQTTAGGMQAVYHGDIDFESWLTGIRPNFKFPVPTGSTDVAVGTTSGSLSWHWASETYPTDLNEMAAIPIVEWDWPTTLTYRTRKIHYTFDYRHSLLPRKNGGYLYFYALGVWKFQPGSYFRWWDQRDLFITFNIPEGHITSGITLAEYPFPYAVVGSQVKIQTSSISTPLYYDLIVPIVPVPEGMRVAGISPQPWMPEQSRFFPFKNYPFYQPDGKPLPVHVTFTRPVRPDTVTTRTFTMTRSDHSGNFDGGRGMTLTPTTVTLASPNVVQIMLRPEDVHLHKFYRVNVKSGTDGVRDTEGVMLDGEAGSVFPSGDGTAGGDFSTMFFLTPNDHYYMGARQWRKYE